MRYRLVFITGVAVGFVLGARAGRERYEQIRKMARKVADSPAVQEAAGALQAQAASYARSAGGKLANRAGAARAKVGEKLHVPGTRASDSNGRPGGEGRGRYTAVPGTPDGAPEE